MWIALPEAERHREPAFCNYPHLLVVQRDGFTLTLLAGSALGQTSPVTAYSLLVGMDLTAHDAAHPVLPLDAAFEYGVLVLAGNATVSGEILAPGELLYFAPGRSELALQGNAPAQILLLGGKPFGEDVLLRGNFVGRNQDDMEQALAAWNPSPNQGGRFGTTKPGSLAAVLHAPSLEGIQIKRGH